MQILITGGGGFIGAWLVRRLAATGHQLRVLEPARGGTELETIAGPSAAAVDSSTMWSRPMRRLCCANPTVRMSSTCRGKWLRMPDVVEAIRAVKPDARISIEGPALPFKADIGEGDLRTVFPALPSTSLRDGIRRTIELYAANP